MQGSTLGQPPLLGGVADVITRLVGGSRATTADPDPARRRGAQRRAAHPPTPQEPADGLDHGEPRVRLVVWGTREPPELRALAARRRVPIWRMEDGFLRSVGLGSDLYAPASLVVDPDGIYYDPTRPSALERILAEATFTDGELERARRLRERIVREGVSKYNIARGSYAGPGDGRSLVLVIGQVEDDASIQLGCLDVRRNEELLRAARSARPDAHLVYKPHPDVVSGNRQDSLPLALARAIADDVVVDASLAECLGAADEVHTMTSLVGFEALLRRLPVSVYGQPFYAGWGLTNDRHPHPRRTRRLTLDELVAGALVRYPRYVSPVTRRFTTPEAIVEHLVRARMSPPAPWRHSWPARQMGKLLNLAKEATRAP
jgi:capsular polysaccharide export protein